MATGKDATRSRVEELKAQLRSIPTCSATTVTELREALAVQAPEPEQKENARLKKGQLLVASSTTRRKAGGPSTLHDAKLLVPPPLGPRERYILATEAANMTLKSLTDALKTQVPAHSRPSAKTKPSTIQNAPKGPKSRPVPGKSATASCRPLQERSVSQITNSPKKPSLRRSSSYSSFLTAGPEAGLVATAECSRIAFAYLATSEAARFTGKDSPELQLENGMLALVGKLVAHGLDALAIKEMRILKKRLDNYLGGRKVNSEAPRTTTRIASGRTLSAEKENLASLLDFGDVDSKSRALPIITSLQCYVLRVIARIKRPQLVEATWNYLKLSQPSSPANLIWHVARRADDRVKSARQLESLAQTILLLCPSISSANDDDNILPSADVVLRLQHLAFRVRQRWWPLAEHHGNEDKELLEPFAKCLVTFSRRSGLPPTKKYKLAESLFMDLLEAGPNAKLGSKNELQVTPLASKSLSSLAQEAGLPDEALRWLDVSNSLGSECSIATNAARLARMATVALEARLKGDQKEEVNDKITNILETLSKRLSGSATEQWSLFLEVHALRRIATRCVSANSSTIEGSIPQSLIQLCVRIIAASIRFTLRFIGTNTDAEAETETTSQSPHADRLPMACKVAKSTIDSALACCKRPIDTEFAWLELDALIQDSIHLQRDIERHTTTVSSLEPKSAGESHSTYVKFSNAYWVIHSQLRKLGVAPAVPITAMQRSTELLLPRPETEREAGLLPTKLERLGESLERLDHTTDSREAFVTCIWSLLGEKQVEDISAAASSSSLRQIFERSHVSTLGRVLKSYHRSFAKWGLENTDRLAFYDDESLPPETRGIILEWQLVLYQKTLSRNRSWDTGLDHSIQTIATRLMDIYIPDRFPIRHQRLHLALFQLNRIRPGIVPEVSLQSNARECVSSSITATHDSALVQFQDHLHSLSTLAFALREPVPSISVFSQCFSTWEYLVDTARSWEDLAARIDDVEYWLHEIQTTIDYCIAKGQEYEALPILHLFVKILELRADPDSSELVGALCTLGLQFLRLGYSGKAGLTFDKAERHLSCRVTSIDTKLRWHLGYAEYLLNIGDVSKSERILSAAGGIAQDDTQFMELAKPSTSMTGRLQFNRILADACYVSSLLSLQKGNQKDAARFARQSVVLNRRIWAALEARSNSRTTASIASTQSGTEQARQANFDPLSSMRNDDGTPLVMSVTHDALNGPDFWPLVPTLYRSLMQHSHVFVNQGLLHEAVYVAEQAEKIARSVGSSSLLVENESHRAEYWIQSGKMEKAQLIFDSVNLDQARYEKHLANVAYLSSVARMHHSNKRFDEEFVVYDQLEKRLSDLMSPVFIKNLDTFTSSVETIVQDMSGMSLSDRLPSEAKVAKGTNRRQATSKSVAGVVTRTGSRTTRKAPLKCAPKVVTKVDQKATSIRVSAKTSVRDECVSLHALQADVIHRRAITDLLQDDISKALELLDNVEKDQKSVDRTVSHIWVRSQAMLSQALKSIAEDFTFNTLLDSTIAFPAIPLKMRQSSEGLAAKRPVVSQPAAKVGRGKKQTKEDVAEILRGAQAYLVDAYSLCATAGSSHTFQRISTALSHVTVLLSAVSGGPLRGSLHPLFAAYMNEIPKCNSLRLAQESVEVEQETMSREEYLKWPTVSSDGLALTSMADFQKEYIDIIPQSWTAISLGLSEEQDELHITRYESGASPFLLRLPMARQSSREMDEEGFTFADGRREFEEIIELSDFSTRNAKDMTSREARVQWWTEREALDTKLHELLLNIENIWLGGFKGIFSQHERRPNHLMRFQKSLEKVLNRHLPSRRKKSQIKKTCLDPRVLELFIGLGDASNEELDIDDALMDLIYFVVDILQFNGEHNAYDEIDFDAMVVETLDALREYHNASPSASPANTHTILILDKRLHMFPWESLPCLESLSVSRLPSLAALRERLLVARSPTVSHNVQPGHYIPAEVGGTSMLNPSGDLTHTFKTIKPHLDGMQGPWNHICNRAPTEKEFEDSLRDKELVLYFGHGSGAQFVKSKSVRRLYLGSQAGCEQRAGCATTFLFGCSSVHLSDNGIYEPSGMLASYLTAGAPAVVGMLWDVTDKDCDRFAVKVGELWGLWPESKEDRGVEAPPTVKKSRGKGKVAQLVEEVESARGATSMRKAKKVRAGDAPPQACGVVPERRRGVGLDEAVRDARKACVLRHLNGAAAVVYGIPVYLE